METYTLITGANGEVGHGLISKLSSAGTNTKIIALDLNDLDKKLQTSVDVFIKGSVTDKELIDKIFSDYKIDAVFHLAAVLSTGGEKNPELAHSVNIGGTFNLLSAANSSAIKERRSVKFIFPSTIAVYGMPDLQSKRKYKKVKEEEFLNPITMYGINKLYCENLGKYFSSYYQSLTIDKKSLYLDFRCVRFPGLISAETIPSGGTSDYAPEMLHAAASAKDYQCFVRPDSTIHFMAMPDAIEALLLLTNTAKNKLTTHVYNIEGFTASASDIEKIVKKHFPKANISYKINPERQTIVDSWSEDVDGSRAEKDWGWRAKYNFKKAFEEYLIPSIVKKYN